MKANTQTVRISPEAAKELVSLITDKVEEAAYTVEQKKGYTKHQVTAYVFGKNGKPAVVTYTWITE